MRDGINLLGPRNRTSLWRISLKKLKNVFGWTKEERGSLAYSLNKLRNKLREQRINTFKANPSRIKEKLSSPTNKGPSNNYKSKSKDYRKNCKTLMLSWPTSRNESISRSHLIRNNSEKWMTSILKAKLKDKKSPLIIMVCLQNLKKQRRKIRLQPRKRKETMLSKKINLIRR